jgi:hypothetical protein
VHPVGRHAHLPDVLRLVQSARLRHRGLQLLVRFTLPRTRALPALQMRIMHAATWHVTELVRHPDMCSGVAEGRGMRQSRSRGGLLLWSLTHCIIRCVVNCDRFK